MDMKKYNLRKRVLGTLFGAATVSLIVAAVDAIRVIISFDYLFQTVLDKLLLVLVSILVYIGVSVLVILTTLMIVNAPSIPFNIKLNNQKYVGFSICITTVVLTLPLLVFFYNSRIRFLFPLRDHIPDLVLIFVFCFILGILVGYLFSQLSWTTKKILKTVVVLFLLPVVTTVVIHLRARKAIVNSRDDKPNVVLIVVDDLRADHLGCYGYHLPTSPNIDRMAKEGILFRQAIAQAPWTLPSVMSLMTSLYPPVHTLILPAHSGRVLDAARMTLAEYLRTEGYQTVAFVGAGGNISSRFFSSGFDFYDDEIAYSTRYNHLVLLNMIGRSFGLYSSRLADTTTEQVQYWISRNKHLPFFIFVHYYDPHSPYGSPEPFTTMHGEDYHGILKPNFSLKTFGERPFNPDDIKYTISLYDGEITFVDVQIGKLVKQLESLELIDNTMIIFTADHGEEFFDHGEFQHGYTLYDEQIKVPLIMKYPPFGKGKIIDNQVQLIDILPTILDTLGIAVNDEAQGISLKSLIKGQDDELPAYSATMTSREVITMRTRKFKFIRYLKDGREELFDLEKDPSELNNLVDKELETVRQMRQGLSNWHDDCKTKAALLSKVDKRKIVPLDNKTIEQLRKLGYF